MTDWLLAPLSGGVSHEIAAWSYWHARCMVLGWGLLLPLGAMVARFCKVTPRQDWPRVLDNPRWWHGHRAFQWVGVAFMTVGLALVLNRPGAEAGHTAAVIHAWAGWAVCVAAWLQILGSLARGSKGGPTDACMRGDHFDMTPWRTRFERVHKALGWGAVVASIVVTGLGLVVADAPRWMALALSFWWLLLLAAFVWLQRAGRCIDTYQAIWGPDSGLPGNRVKPVGWGVRRPLG